MSVVSKSEKKLHNAGVHNKAHEKQGWLQRFLSWLNQGTQKALRQQGNCFS